MALSQRKRQKKQERKNAKQRAKKRAIQARSADDLSCRFERAVAAPVLHCYTSRTLWEDGVGYLFFSRKLSSGNVAFACFLVDVYCLGVKDVFYDIASHARYAAIFDDYCNGPREMTPVSPHELHCLLDGAVAYAGDLGLAPHGEYKHAAKLLGEIDPQLPRPDLRFGREGKPFFVPGPYEGPARCQQVISQLTKSCGTGGFDCLMLSRGLSDQDVMRLDAMFDE